MKPVYFLNNSPQIEKIIKGFTLTKSLYVSSLLIGEMHTGKKTLIQTLFPSSIYVDAHNQEELISALKIHDELVIYNFEALLNFEDLNFDNKRIIAIANHIHNSKKIKEKFAFIYHMPNILSRSDKKELIHYLKKEVEKKLMLEESPPINETLLDFSENIKSLKASIYKQIIYKQLDRKEIEALLFDYFLENMEERVNVYREELELFEKPLIKAGLQRFKSQLKLSTVLGLNRNTLRKKIQEHGLD